VPQGHVTPLAVANDATHQVVVVLDKALEGQNLGVHPLTNEATIVVSYQDLEKFLAAQGNPVKVVDFDAAPAPAPADKKEKKEEKKEQKKPAKKKGETMLGIEAKKAEDFPLWYSQVVTRAEMIEYYDISGCYILRPWSMFIWKKIRAFFDEGIENLGVEEAYFPLFVSQKRLEAEKDHVEGFAPEVAWVTKAGNSDLEQPIAVRPTSETIMYPAYAKWIRSHRDLPLKLNQWCSVVRWEFKNPTPFIRTREFLWQEGHTAFATLEEAAEEVTDILELYRRVYEELLAVPVVKGKKTENEKFAGGYYTTSIEAFVPSTGRGIQAATSHCLGQNFAKMFDIEFEDDKGKKRQVWQNSWGLTTRTIGVMTMVHGDDKGLVLPPRVAQKQVVVIPVLFKESDNVRIAEGLKLVERELKTAGVRFQVDDDTNHNPGWKYNQYEMKGVPLRIEIGPKDVEKKQVRAVRRDNSAAEDIAWDQLATRVPQLLNQIQDDMLARARKTLDERTNICVDWEQFSAALDKRNLALSTWCGDSDCEAAIKKRSGEQAKDEVEEHQAGDEGATGNANMEKLTGAAKSLNVPFEQPKLEESHCCVGCGKKATTWALFGRSY